MRCVNLQGTAFLFLLVYNMILNMFLEAKK